VHNKDRWIPSWSASGRRIPEVGPAEGKQDRGRPSSPGSRAHVDLDPTEYGEKKRNFVGQHFWARGYFVSTVGRDTEMIREYIKKQEEEDKRLEQMNLWR
jgi:hypothetical protein